MDDPSDYLEPTESVQSDQPKIRELSAELCRQAVNEHERARRLFEYVRDEIKYDVYSPFHLPEHYRASAILKRGKGYCVQKAVLLAALARAAGIPARLIFADLVNHRAPDSMKRLMDTDLFTYHCYDELYLGGKWVKMVPAFDRFLCEEQGYPLVEFDGHNDALFAPVDAKGRKFMEYVANHGAYADVPMQPMLAAWERVYGKERVALWKKVFENQNSKTKR